MRDQIILEKRIPRKESDREIWLPNWNCFCCHDTGTISASLLSVYLKTPYNPDPQDGYGIPACRRRGCHSEIRVPESVYDANVNDSFSPEVCEELHQLELDAWRNNAKEQQKLIQAKKQLQEIGGYFDF